MDVVSFFTSVLYIYISIILLFLSLKVFIMYIGKKKLMYKHSVSAHTRIVDGMEEKYHWFHIELQDYSA